MKKPILVIMAAGMGSRYGGLKQIDTLDGHGHTIIDYSVYDAMAAGFRDFVFVIKREIEADFRAVIGEHLKGKDIRVRYAYQELDAVPEGMQPPHDRKKPYGTAHAILCAQDLIDSPFAVINSDDYYGKQAFIEMYSYLSSLGDDSDGRYAMIGYRIGNTVSPNGGVSRGICKQNARGELSEIKETHNVMLDGTTVYTEGECGRAELDPDTLVSMNFWGFDVKFLEKLKKSFASFFKTEISRDPHGAEFALPTLIADLLGNGECTVSVLKTDDKWYGVTSRADREEVSRSLSNLIDSGEYPADF